MNDRKTKKNKPLILSWNRSFFKPRFQTKTQVIDNLNLTNNCPNDGAHFKQRAFELLGVHS